MRNIDIMENKLQEKQQALFAFSNDQWFFFCQYKLKGRSKGRKGERKEGKDSEGEERKKRRKQEESQVVWS